MNKIELKKSEVEAFVYREGLITQKLNEAELLKREYNLFTNEIRIKYEKDGVWIRNGDCLVEQEEQTV